MKNKKDLRKRDSVFLGDEIGEYLESLKADTKNKTKKGVSKRNLQKSMNLLVCWEQIVTPRINEHTDNVVYSTRSEETELLVYVDSAAYATELTMDKELYRIKMQNEIGKEIADIKFLVSRKIKGR